MITSPADTLVCDSAQLAAFRSDAAYDYNRELITPEINIFEWIRGQFGELLGKIFGSGFAAYHDLPGHSSFASDCLVCLQKTSRTVHAFA